MKGSIDLTERERKRLLKAYRSGDDVRKFRRVPVLPLLADGLMWEQMRKVLYGSNDVIAEVRRVSRGRSRRRAGGRNFFGHVAQLAGVAAVGPSVDRAAHTAGLRLLPHALVMQHASRGPHVGIGDSQQTFDWFRTNNNHYLDMRHSFVKAA